MTVNPYKILGIKGNATQKEIRQAYHALAKSSHPDMCPDDPQAEERFKTISAAFSLLSDPEKRLLYDWGTAESMQTVKVSEKKEAPSPHHNSTVSPNLFPNKFGAHGVHQRQFGRKQVEAKPGHITINFMEALKGVRRHLVINGKSMDITIAAGVQSGQTLKLKKPNAENAGEQPPEIRTITVNVKPHAFYERDGCHVRYTLPITIKEAILGAKISVPTPYGPEIISIPKYARTGLVIRLKGGGVLDKGDLFIHLDVHMPKETDPELEAFLKNWSSPQTNLKNIRQNMLKEA